MSRADYIAKYFEKDTAMTAADKTPTPRNLCNCPDCQTNDCPAGIELAAKTRELAEARAGERLISIYIEEKDHWKADAKRLREEKEFYKRRCDALQNEQSGMRDPERQIVCDILANGKRDAAIDAARAQGGERG